ncbi:LRRN4 C-terminal-like protein [Xiphias gladius]|uniref:LRRN4 C-terminal-like protein n=1 Tax=Xiphias gladius TaxID=8245 RepID=UPI001A98603B|nr:LRRN4 C-terminal-like protein [Xiphias gladius]XP_040006538.1 LRRN4 C-terminal-like protein [Xiphias gladius]
MAASRDLPFILAIISQLFIRGYSPLPMMSRMTGTNPMRPLSPGGFSNEALLFTTEDYTQLEDIVQTILPRAVSPHGGRPQKCNYDPCLENHSCAELGAATGCLCPGLTPYNIVPEAPRLKSVSWNGSEVVIQWCAPNSYVKGYVVTVCGKERQMVGKDRRSSPLGDINHCKDICVVAVNDGGASNGSCVEYPPGDKSLPLKAGLIGGALGFLLLLLLAVLLLRRKRQRKQEAIVSMHDTAETQ